MFEIGKWYEYRLKGSRKKVVGQCVGVSNLFVTFKTGLKCQSKEDTLIELQNMVDKSAIVSYEPVLNRYVERVSRGNEDHFRRTDK